MPRSAVHGRSRRRVLDGGRSLDGLHGRDAVADHASGRDRDRAVRFPTPVLPSHGRASFETDEVYVANTQLFGLDVRSDRRACTSALHRKVRSEASDFLDPADPSSTAETETDLDLASVHTGTLSAPSKP